MKKIAQVRPGFPKRVNEYMEQFLVIFFLQGEVGFRFLSLDRLLRCDSPAEARKKIVEFLQLEYSRGASGAAAGDENAL